MLIMNSNLGWTHRFGGEETTYDLSWETVSTDEYNELVALPASANVYTCGELVLANLQPDFRGEIASPLSDDGRYLPNARCRWWQLCNLSRHLQDISPCRRVLPAHRVQQDRVRAGAASCWVDAG